METKKTILFLLLLIISSCKTGLITDELKKGITTSEKIDFASWKEKHKELQGKGGEYPDVYYFKNGREVLISCNQSDILPPKPLFYLEYKKFHDNGFIKQRGKYFGEFKVGSNKIKIGMWYEFDEKGNLTKQTDEDTKFGAFGYNDVLRFLDKKGDISLSNGKNRENLQIYYYSSTESNKKLWEVFVYLSEATQIIGEGYTISRKRKGYDIDGNTGEIVKYKDLIKYKEIIRSFDRKYPDLK
jgi:hypothetical protein